MIHYIKLAIARAKVLNLRAFRVTVSQLSDGQYSVGTEYILKDDEPDYPPMDPQLLSYIDQARQIMNGEHT